MLSNERVLLNTLGLSRLYGGLAGVALFMRRTPVIATVAAGPTRRQNHKTRAWLS